MNTNTTNCDDYAAEGRPATRVFDEFAQTSPPASEWSDQQLVRACLEGDQSAWAALIRRYQNVMYFFARRYGASAADAADVFQLVCAVVRLASPSA
jgi:hypothetical protein